jgi:hypothetical protein
LEQKGAKEAKEELVGCDIGPMVECPARKTAGSFMRFTIRDLLWLMVVVAVALAIYFARPRRPHWDYTTKTIASCEDFHSIISAQGNEGWELVQVEREDNLRTLYFKRPK